MATYLVLNLIVIAAICIALRQYPKRLNKAWLFTLVGLLVLTAVFDNLIIMFDIVHYDVQKILGLYVGIAPIEDFMYAVMAVILVPALWHKLKGKDAQ